ncbi:hypothetical protein [Blastococcus sp. VKM Ac-2987]|uniref:hypothetical protein n=1 Tax=Blastococcus sp. VKM Ac-2987 TaxID=3004141 RepID=UPI0022AB8BCD|nr:hypothetical protein [Blastococcus sp. VKM Ac-2987]MCZ2857655.1 hypothetical protein [Blastococcus sp. VKM Ac-2987]
MLGDPGGPAGLGPTASPRRTAAELLRRAALLAASRIPDGDRLAVSADDLGAALDELLDTRNAMTRTLLVSAPG